MNNGNLVASGHNWVEGQGSGPRIDGKKDEEEDQFDSMSVVVSKRLPMLF